MLEIKTIIYAAFELVVFDTAVNDHLAAGWELVRRDVLVPGDRDRGPILYAELEREIEPEEEEEPEDDSTAEWALIRNPVTPFKCSKCGYKNDEETKTCPGCGRVMVQ